MQSDITTVGEKENNSKSSTAVDYENEALDTRCGYTASCKPKGLQKFASPKAFLVLITTYAMVQGEIVRQWVPFTLLIRTQIEEVKTNQ